MLGEFSKGGEKFYFQPIPLRGGETCGVSSLGVFERRRDLFKVGTRAGVMPESRLPRLRFAGQVPGGEDVIHVDVIISIRTNIVKHMKHPGVVVHALSVSTCLKQCVKTSI